MSKRTPKPISALLIKEAYSLIMKGHTPLMIKSALDLNDIEWGIINQSKLYHQLIIQKDLKQCGIESRSQRLKGIELTLFNILDRYKNTGSSSEHRAKLGRQIDQLKEEYSQFNIYN